MVVWISHRMFIYQDRSIHSFDSWAGLVAYLDGSYNIMHPLCSYCDRLGILSFRARMMDDAASVDF
jgi:hypothetical protein